jgi:hypothetical protein
MATMRRNSCFSLRGCTTSSKEHRALSATHRATRPKNRRRFTTEPSKAPITRSSMTFLLAVANRACDVSFWFQMICRSCGMERRVAVSSRYSRLSLLRWCRHESKSRLLRASPQIARPLPARHLNRGPERHGDANPLNLRRFHPILHRRNPRRTCHATHKFKRKTLSDRCRTSMNWQIRPRATTRARAMLSRILWKIVPKTVLSSGMCSEGRDCESAGMGKRSWWPNGRRRLISARVLTTSVRRISGDCVSRQSFWSSSRDCPDDPPCSSTDG